MKTPPRTSLAELIDAFDIFFIDQYGVLHHGERPYDGTVAALRDMRSRGKRVVLLSNSGKRSNHNAARLRELGFPPDCWDLFVSAGEVAWRMLSDGRLRIPHAPDRPVRCLVFERGGGHSSADGLGYELVASGEDADLVLVAGCDGEKVTLEDYEKRYAPAALRGVPAICTNPDMVQVTAAGPCFGPGRIAERYAALGGPVIWIGKPFPDIYRVAMEEIGATPADRILCIGDSVEHDIAGARAAGLQSALVVDTGILAGLSEAELADVYARHGATPDFIVPTFAL